MDHLDSIAKHRLLAASALGLALTMAAPAMAGDNDFNLSKLAEREEVRVVDPDLGVEVTRFNAIPDVEAFKAFSRDLGTALGPRFLAPAETLGQAGFDMGVDLSLSTFDKNAEHWRALNAEPSGNFVTGQFHIRKGLPFSLEIGGSLTHLFGSELFVPGVELKFSLNEGFLFLPDIAVRGNVNVVTGSSDLNMATTGFDISISKAFGLVGMVNITPYIGYNQLVIISSSRLLDVAPEDPTQPTINEDSGLLDFQPEFVFSTEIQTLNRFFFGTRFIFGVLNLTAEAAIVPDGVNTYSARLGFDF